MEIVHGKLLNNQMVYIYIIIYMYILYFPVLKLQLRSFKGKCSQPKCITLEISVLEALGG